MRPTEISPGCPVITQAYGCTSFAGEWAVSPSVCPSTWFHRGLDVAGERCCDTPMLAVGDGTVQAVGQTFSGSSGLGPGAILLRMTDGVLAVYGHGYAEVAVGQRVAKGARIGRVGSQGFSTGCHVHLEICTQLGTVPQGCINPLSYDGPGAPPEPPKPPRMLPTQGGGMIQILSRPDGFADILAVGTDGQIWWQGGKGTFAAMAAGGRAVGGNGRGGVRSFSATYWGDYSHIDIVLVNAADGSKQACQLNLSNGAVNWGEEIPYPCLVPVVRQPGAADPEPM